MSLHISLYTGIYKAQFITLVYINIIKYVKCALWVYVHLCSLELFHCPQVKVINSKNRKMEINVNVYVTFMTLFEVRNKRKNN